MNGVACPDENELVAFALGRLDDRSGAAIEGHLDGCASCHRLLSLLVEPDAATLPAKIARGTSVGRYLIVEPIGSGAVAVVYAAYDPELDRKVALKLLRGRNDLPRAPERQLRLLREARAMAQLSHPHVIQVYDVGTVGGAVFIAMELVHGATLAEWLRGEPRSWPDIRDLFVQAGRGLEVAHAAGLVHRDFKPANVLVGHDGRARVADFGLARPLVETEAGDGAPALASTLTQSGVVLGTPVYMAPEALAGEPANPRSDQFSYCAALWQAVYGQRPFSGETVNELITAIGRGPMSLPAARRDLPPHLEETLRRGLTADASARFADMGELLARLADDPRRRRRQRTRSLALLALATVALLGVVGSGLGLRARRRALCSGAPALVAGVWNPERRARLRDRFVTTGLPYAAAIWQHVDAAVGDYAASWSRMRTAACVATHLTHEQSERLLDLRMLCLDQRLHELDALAAGWMSVDKPMVEQALTAAQSLPALGRCADGEWLTAAFAPPADAATRARIDALRVRLAQASAEVWHGHFTRAHELAAPAVAAAIALGYRPLQAEASMLDGRVEESLGHYAIAERRYQEAAWAAEAGKHDIAGAEAQLRLANVVGFVQSRSDDGERLMHAAEAALERAGARPELEMERQRVLGNLAVRRGQPAQAAEHFAKRVALLERHADESDQRLPRTLNAEGAQLENLGRYPEAKQRYTRALALQRKHLAPDHPDVAYSLENLGVLANREGRPDEALQLLRQALAIAEPALATDHPQVAEIVDAVADSLWHLGAFDDAAAMEERALASYTRRLGADAPAVMRCRGNLAGIRAHQGRVAESLALYTQVLAAGRKRYGEKSNDVAGTYESIAEAELLLGHDAAAVADAERALDIYTAIEPKQPDVIDTRLVLSAALRAQHQAGLALGEALRAQQLSRELVGAGSRQSAVALVAVAQARLLLGQVAPALDDLDRALPMLRASRGLPGDLADAEFALARALWAKRQEPARALTLAHSARARLGKYDQPRTAIAIETWLKEHAALSLR